MGLVYGSVYQRGVSSLPIIGALGLLMIEFSASGEIDVEFSESYRLIRNSFISMLNSQLGENYYGNVVKKIFIAPIIRGKGKISRPERALFKRANGLADYRLNIAYDEWKKGTEPERLALLVNNLIFTIDDLERKIGKDFYGDSLIKDVKRLFNV